MTRNVPLSFLEIEVKVDEIKKYVGKPMIFLILDRDESGSGNELVLTSGILEDVNENQIFMEDNVSHLDQGLEHYEPWQDYAMIEEWEWVLWGADFTKECQDFISKLERTGGRAVDTHPKLLLKNIQFMYVSKIDATLEQMQNAFTNPDEPMTSLEKIMCIYCWETFPEEKLKQHQKICDDSIETCPKCHDGIGGTKKELDEHLTWCAERFYTSTDVKDEQKDHIKKIEKYGSLENYNKKQENETKSYQESIKKQADAWKRIKDKKG